MIIWLKMWPLERTQGFSKIWPSDFDFGLAWPIFKVIRDLIKANILTKFHDYQTENVASRAYTGKKLTTDLRHSTITIALSEHFVLKWAKKSINQGQPTQAILNR